MWHPKEDDLIKFKVLLMVSIPLCMLIPLVLTIIMPSPVWYLLAGLWLLFTIVARIISSVRFSSKFSDDVKLSRIELFKKLPKEKKKQFKRMAFIAMPTIFIVSMSGFLWFMNFIGQLTIGLAVVVLSSCFALFAYITWNYYNKLVQGKDDVFP
jgi:archaellum biogenesis protein FlaJ (TadC family)